MRNSAVLLGLVVLCLVISASAVDIEFGNCNCDYEGFWTIHNILECQRVSDVFIAIAYFSIPIELLYFISCSNLPFKWVLVQFIAFIVLCGLTHLINAWTYYGPHSFQLVLSLTVAKLLTALVSCATAITLLTLIPLLLKLKVRELFLRQNVLELDQEVGMMKKKKEASSHVRMLTQEIRKSLDRHTILYTTLVELSKTLDLHNCAVWMPNAGRTEMNLTHELKARSSRDVHNSIPITDTDVAEVKKNKGVRILKSTSALARASSSGLNDEGAVAAIRMPMLRFINIEGGTPGMVETCYAILVLVLPNSRDWSYQEMEIIGVVADQVAVALSHAAVLEDSQLMREKLAEQNRELQQAKKSAMMASQARDSFQKVMSQGMRRPMHSVLGLLSLVQDESMKFEQKNIVDTLIKTSSVLTLLMNDAMDVSANDPGKLLLVSNYFGLRSMVKEASCLAKCLSVYRGFEFEVDVQSSLPDHVIGDEKRTFQVILHMAGYLLDLYQGGMVIFRVSSEKSSQDVNEGKLSLWRSSIASEHVCVRFEIEIRNGISVSNSSMLDFDSSCRKLNFDKAKEQLSFSMCKKLVQMMQGDIQSCLNSQGFAQSMTFLLKFQVPSGSGRAISTLQKEFASYSRFKGLRVLVADDCDVNRRVTKRLLEKLGCEVVGVSSGFECLSAVTHAENSFKVVVLDLQMPEMDGFEVATRIRKYRSRNWPLIIALTASAEEHVAEKCMHVGMNGVLQKPVLLQDMANEVGRVLQRVG